MSISFLALPRELRDKIYELCLLVEEPIIPWDDRYRKQDDLSHFEAFRLRRGDLAPGLLGSNKAINSEASSILYQNKFDLTSFTPERVALFLDEVGRNVDYIRHVYISFPRFRNLGIGTVEIEEDDSSILASIQSSCSNLQTLTTCRDSWGSSELILREVNLNVVTEALAVVDSRFRAISSLQDIIVEVFEESPSNFIGRQGESHGWTIVAKDSAYDWMANAYASFEDALDRYQDELEDFLDDDNHEEYDLEHDSDFWRRAAD